ncbi:histidine kinase [Chitinophagaceae bacterium MMS25-I14]
MQNRIWMGVIDGLYRLSDHQDTVLPFMPSSSFFKTGVNCIRQMYNGIHVVGTRFGGIVIMKDANHVTQITAENGLLSNSIKYLLPVKNRLWAVTSKGISVINFTSFAPLQYTITNIGKNEGFYNMVIYQIAAYKGCIYAATSRGMYIIDNPEKFLDKYPQPIPLYISNINYYKGDTINLDKIKIPFNNSRVVIQISAVCFNSAEDVKYYYRINKAETAWRSITGNELLLEKLPPGDYMVEIMAAIPNQGRFSEIKHLEIIIEKPWWQNNWLRLGAVLLCSTIIVIIYKKRIRKIKKSEEQKTALNAKLAELKQTSLRAQMNPHFIFNCLTSIQQLIVTGNAEDANDYLVRFSRLIRKTLELSAFSFISIADEKEYLTEYIILEQLRLPGQFDYEFLIDPSIDERRTEIPNMMLQPIIENSIRHGIKHLETRKGRITVALQKNGDFICCIITDNGIGRNPYDKKDFTEHRSYGMKIVYERLENIEELKNIKDSLIEIKDLKDNNGITGTEVTFKFPYKMKAL